MDCGEIHECTPACRSTSDTAAQTRVCALINITVPACNAREILQALSEENWWVLQRFPFLADWLGTRLDRVDHFLLGLLIQVTPSGPVAYQQLRKQVFPLLK